MDQEIFRQVKAGWDHVAKPLDGFGIFEELLCRIGAIQGKACPALSKSRVIVCCADNGIVEEGVSQSGQEITAICAENIGGGRSSVGILAARAGVDVLAVDIGVNCEAEIPNVRSAKVRRGTRNFHKEPAMTPEEVQKAMQIGMELVRESREAGYEILGIGEMGIGNTTTSSAVTAAVLGLSPEIVTGRGAGLDDERLFHKREIIREALLTYGFQAEREQIREERERVGAQSDAPRGKQGGRALDALTKVGGLDIACMAGICLGGARYHVPIVLDGFISLTAALVACRLEPAVREVLIPSHSGKEPAMAAIEKELGLAPVLYAKMALGEGTGAVLMLQLLKTVHAVYEKSCSFETAGIRQYERFERKN